MGGKNVELVFIPFPVLSHLVAMVKLAKLLTDKDRRLSVTILVLKLPTDTKIDSYTKNLHFPRMNIVQIPYDESLVSELMKTPKTFMIRFIESQRKAVRAAVAGILGDSSRSLAGFVLDMFCTCMVEVAEELRIPAYIGFTSSAATLGLMLHFQLLNDEGTAYDDLEAVPVPTFVNPVPISVLPSPVLGKEADFFMHMTRFRKCKGIVVNSFLGLETHAVQALSGDANVPKVYPVGPIIHDSSTEEESDEKRKEREEILEWLDGRPNSSVIYLCFGSTGSFESDQVKEIATALERSGHLFLWSLRKPPVKGKFEFAGEYNSLAEALPDGFLQRTAGVGKVIGWAPQMAVLSHPAVGGFVTHCGWNSTLESVWCGVPMAVWPLFAEQQANAFQLVKEFGIAVEIKMDYRKECNVIVAAEKIEGAFRELMDMDNEIRVRVKALKDKSRSAYEEEGSSRDFLERLVQDFIDNVC